MGEEVQADEVIEAKGLHVFPGLIDAHQHLGIYNSIEYDFRDTKQHAVGGVTTIVNYDRQPVSYLDYFPKVKEIGEKNSYIDFTYSLGILKEEHLNELEELVETHNLTSFKFFRNYERQLNDKFKISDGIDLSSFDLMKILERFKEISPKLLLSVHCENMDINRKLTEQLIQSGEDNGLRTWSKTSPGYAEAESLLSTLYLNHVIGGNLFIVHLSSAESVDVLENTPWLREKGVVIETCPHYLCFSKNHEVGIKAKVGPPIHAKEDSERLWDGIRNGTINAIGTDHVPNSLQKKLGENGGVWETQFGFPGMGTLLQVMLTEGYKKRNIPLERIADITSLQLAESYNLQDKGRIQVGADADFAIVDLNQSKKVTVDCLNSKTDYSIYDGMDLTGWPVFTISRGEVIVENGIPTKENGRGKFIKRFI
ncbi:dihydroorotase [Sporosarcina ureilytica]|uniref:Amidohydrolase-related domain-containing protein n=1 Tax=Sporosarcina ureilytica TaxID=298596 RepID=A0A1D8JFC8_9BACL|nr:amidohydrolase family protein [Sporosarcina ureilytica]AOV07417.1 hypothetical protein BI350_07610 [Sporosarcina ureilytica]